MGDMSRRLRIVIVMLIITIWIVATPLVVTTLNCLEAGESLPLVGKCTLII